MSRVFQSFTTQLSEQINHTNVKTERGKSRLARDASYFTRRLKSLHHVDPPSNSVMESVDTIIITASSPPTKELTPSDSNPSTP
jgi:vacuolar protein sorting-associated protein 54